MSYPSTSASNAPPSPLPAATWNRTSAQEQQKSPLGNGLQMGLTNRLANANGHLYSTTMQPSHSASLTRSAAQNHQLDQSDNVKVAVRVRPMSDHEREKGASSVIQVGDDAKNMKVVVQGPGGSTMQRDFQFHAVLGPDVYQADVMSMCGLYQLLDAAMLGYNVTVFAYGQTGSGKTFTMSGHEEVVSGASYEGDKNDGIVTRAVQYLYGNNGKKGETKCNMTASYLEIYNEGIYDLLNPKAKNLPVKWEAAQGFFVPGLKQVPCSNVSSMMEVIRVGMHHRRVGSHELNMESSRSHSIMTIQLVSSGGDPSASDYGTARYGKISFVDLAGSERLKETKSEGQMMKETTNINKSLFVLGKVIASLAERDQSGSNAHIPYRDSKLTKLLMDSLGGSALALMIACCSPASSALEETLNTLSYATRAKNITNRPTVQYDPKEAATTALRHELDLLRSENAYLREQLRGQGWLGSAPTAGTGLIGSIPPTPNLYPFSAAGPSSLLGLNCTSPRGSQAGTSTSAGPSAPSSNVLMSQTSGGSTFDAPHRNVISSGGGAAGQSSSYGSVVGQMLPSPITPRALPISVPGLDPVRNSAEMTDAMARNGRMSPAVTEFNLDKRLKETQALLLRFSEDNSRLARENDRLRAGRQVMGAEHSEVLDEIDTLRGKLAQLETAVLSGEQTPDIAKATLLSMQQTGNNPSNPSPHVSMSGHSGYASVPSYSPEPDRGPSHLAHAASAPPLPSSAHRRVAGSSAEQREQALHPGAVTHLDLAVTPSSSGETQSSVQHSGSSGNNRQTSRPPGVYRQEAKRDGEDGVIVADRSKLSLLLGDIPGQRESEMLPGPMRPLPVKPPLGQKANPLKVQHEAKLLQRSAHNN